MKKVFAVLFVAGMASFAACTSKSEETKVDSTAAAVVDSAAAVVDTAAAVVDSAAAKVDSAVKH